MKIAGKLPTTHEEEDIISYVPVQTNDNSGRL